jgi:uncharacterized membrane protein YidH (DUF202 family)
MVPSYSDHAANERTFLAWVRTGIATRDISGALNALLADFFALYPADRRRKPGLRHVDSKPGPDREPAAKTEAHLDSGRSRD